MNKWIVMVENGKVVDMQLLKEDRGTSIDRVINYFKSFTVPIEFNSIIISGLDYKLGNKGYFKGIEKTLNPAQLTKSVARAQKSGDWSEVTRLIESAINKLY